MDIMEQLIDRLDEAGKLRIGILDEAVQEAASKVVSGINNQGDEAQLEYLLRHVGEDEVSAIVEGLISAPNTEVTCK